MFGFPGEPENRYGSKEKDWYLGADGAEGVREPFIGEEFWCEHDEERSEKKGIYDETKVTVVIAQTAIEESEEAKKEHTESGQEESADDGIENRIGRIVVSPILITEERVLDEGCRKSLGEGSWKIAVIHFRGENGDMGRSGFEIFGMGDEEMEEHRSGCDEGTENEDESVFPEAPKEAFV